MGHPSVYPTGTTIFDPKKSWSGYTLFQAPESGAVLIDMNGREVRYWPQLRGFPNKMLPGGSILGHSAERDPRFGMQDMVDLIQVDWEGNITWKFDGYELIDDPENETRWMARAHHDYQRAGNPVGYYAPGLEPQTDGGNTLILAHKNLYNQKITDKLLLDDTIIEVDWQGKVIWEWRCSDHFEELGFDEDARKALWNNPNMRAAGGGMGDWMHINSMSALGPNKWYDAGDERFHPDNIIWDARAANIMAIIDKVTGKIVWRLGPDFSTPELKHLGWIIGQHHVHMIPRGLPGEGNILIFDNGGWAGYGTPNPASPDGVRNVWRDYSRVLEIDPVTLDIIWRYSPYEAEFPQPTDSYRFYSPYISNIQRLPNGNTLINEGSNGRIFEVTPEHEIVWEYVSPYWGSKIKNNMLYRAYRVPYDWIPQLAVPEEVPIIAVDVTHFRQPGAASLTRGEVIEVAGVKPYKTSADALCVAIDGQTIRHIPKVFSVDLQRFPALTNIKMIDAEPAVLLFVGVEHSVQCRHLWRQLKNDSLQPQLAKFNTQFLDADAYSQQALVLEVHTLPALLVIKQGQVVQRYQGKSNLEEVTNWLATQ